MPPEIYENNLVLLLYPTYIYMHANKQLLKLPNAIKQYFHATLVETWERVHRNPLAPHQKIMYIPKSFPDNKIKLQRVVEYLREVDTVRVFTLTTLDIR